MSEPGQFCPGSGSGSGSATNAPTTAPTCSPNTGLSNEGGCPLSCPGSGDCSGCQQGDVALHSATASQDGGVSGLLVTWYNGNWGTVCDDVTDCDTNGCSNGYVNVAGGQQLAATVCRELGYTGGEEYNADGRCTGYPIVVDGTSNHIIGCNGTESEFKECANILFGSAVRMLQPDKVRSHHGCNHGEDVGVSCGTQTTSSNTGSGSSSGVDNMATNQATIEGSSELSITCSRSGGVAMSNTQCPNCGALNTGLKPVLNCPVSIILSC